MTLRHVVTWKLGETDPSKKAEQTAWIKDTLESLPGLVPGVLSLTVGVNGVESDTNWDVVLISDYATEEDYKAYVEHPAHQKAVAGIVPLVASQATVDFFI